ncbi:MAG: T9SS type A sorting domain-containing protein [Ferruginibacter sp.]|nr:T9SS type A sorting domain-containing protein [Ferruginibacter sp.]
MRKALCGITKILPVILFILFFSNPSFAQKKVWTDINSTEAPISGKRYTFPKEYRLLKLDVQAIRTALATAPMEKQTTSDIEHGIHFDLPMPDGTFQSFKLVEYFVMHPQLAARYPQIKTYTGQGITNPMSTIKVDITPLGFHAMVLNPNGSVFIDPYMENNTDYYICYNKSSLSQISSFECGVTAEKIIESIPTNYLPKSTGTQLRTYRLALACTGEYAATKGGTVAGALAGMTTSMNRVNGIYETEVDIRMVMVANNDQLVYLNASTDPYTNNNGSTMLGQNITTCNSVIGSANYDIGHVFSTGGGGVAYLGVPCTSNKAGGVTGSSNPVGDAYDIDYVAHEMGHQFGGNHSFNATTGSCGGGNREASAAYEPGSGITIMGYAGICLASNNLDAHSIGYFTSKSFDEIITYSQSSNGNSCPVITSTGNNAPIVTSLGLNKAIPISTPFTLTGSAYDPDGDNITYSWEQYDLGPAGNWNVQSTTAPMFRPFEPTSSPSRTFPKMADVVNNTTTIGELLPNIARTLNFRLTARDNRSGGAGLSHPDTTLKISVVNNGGAFSVTSPNTAVTWAGNSTQTITWNVNGTTNTPINTAFVKISLSTDGGYNYPTVIVASTPNDGSESITVPNINTTQARIKVEAIDNYFFDISNINFTINATAGITSISTGSISPSSFCAGASVSVPYTVSGTGNAGNQFIAMLSNASGSFASQVNIGAVSATGSGTISATIPMNTPAGTGYRIRVVSTNPAVTGADNGSNLTVLTIPTASNISPNGNTTFCTGGSVVLQGNNGGTWNTGSSAASITVSTAGTYYVTNTNSCGSVQSNSITVTVNPLPVASSISANGNTTFCSGGSVVLQGNNGGTWNTGSSAASITVSTAGTYYVTNTNSCGSVQSNSITVTVNPLPVASSISANGNTTFCSGGSVVLQGNNGGTWNTGSSAASITVSTAGTYYVTNTNSCGSVQSNSITVTVNPLPVASSISANGNTTFCSGGSVVLQGNNGGTWNTGSSAASITVSTAGTYYVTNTNSCGSVQSNSITVTVGGLENVSIGSYGPFTINSSNITLSGSPSGGTFSGTGISGNSFSPSTAGIGNHSIQYTYTDVYGCTKSAFTTISVIAEQCEFSPGVVTGPRSVCFSMDPNGPNAVYSVNPTNPGTITWYVPHNAQIISGQGTTSIEVKFAPNYTNGYVTAKIINPCDGSLAVVNTNARAIAPNQPGSISGSVNSCLYIGTGLTGLYTIRKVPYADSYIWRVPVGINIINHPNGQGANDTIIEVSFNNNFVVGSTIGVRSVSYCGTSSERTLTITGSNPLRPGGITGPTESCPYVGSGDPAIYTIRKVASASSFQWNVPSGATIINRPGAGTPNDTIIHVQFSQAFTGGQVSVASVNGCSTSSLRSITIKKSTPIIPSKIYGDPNSPSGPLTVAPVNACPYVFTQTPAVYSISKDRYGYTNGYVWTLSDNVNAHIVAHPGGNGVNDTIIEVMFDAGFSSTTLSVAGISGCGTSPARVITITKKAPTTPSAITGNPTPCPLTTQTYTTIGEYADWYEWTLPANTTLISGQGSNTITIFTNANFISGTLKVQTSSDCGSSSVRSLRMTKCKTLPQRPDFVNTNADQKFDELKIFPNPGNGDFYIYLPSKINTSKAGCTILDITGRVISNTEIQLVQGKAGFNLQHKLLPGVYFIQVIIEKQKYTTKLIVK